MRRKDSSLAFFFFFVSSFLDPSRRTFSACWGEGCVCTHRTPLPAYAPDEHGLFFTRHHLITFYVHAIPDAMPVLISDQFVHLIHSMLQRPKSQGTEVNKYNENRDGRAGAKEGKAESYSRD